MMEDKGRKSDVMTWNVGVVGSCNECPIGKYDQEDYGERKGCCRYSDSDRKWCPIRFHFGGKPVVYLVSRDCEEGFVDASKLYDMRAFADFDDAKAYVESQTLEAVCLCMQHSHWRSDGKARRPSRFWTPEDSPLFDEVPELDGDPFFDAVALETYVEDEFDPAFARELDDGNNEYDVLMNHLDSPQADYFQRYGMTRWYHKDEIVDRATAHARVCPYPYVGDYPDYGKTIQWNADYAVYDEWFDDYRDVCETSHGWTIRMVEVGHG